MKPHFRPGFYWWLGLVGYVSFADGWLAKKNQKRRRNGTVDMRYTSMSGVWWDSLQHPFSRLPILALWSMLTTHLFAPFFPEWVKKIDPINNLVHLIGKYVIGD